MFISDRDKGITSAVLYTFPNSIPAHCCQHIADNIQAKFRNKGRPYFWKVIRAKTRELFL